MKETKKQIRAQLINEVRKQFEFRLQQKDDQIAHMQTLFNREQDRRIALEQKNNELVDANLRLREQVKAFEDWTERMQDFCNLPEEERGPAFRTYLDELRTRQQSEEAMNGLVDRLSVYSSFLGFMGL